MDPNAVQIEVTYTERLVNLRQLVMEIVHDYSNFGRRADGKETAFKRIGVGSGSSLKTLKLNRMIRFTEERKFDLLAEKLATLALEVAHLESSFGEAAEEYAEDSEEWYDEEPHQEEE